MATFNKVFVVGYVGKDPELRYLPSGTPVATFSIASRERRKKDGENVDITTWFSVQAWGKLGENVSTYIGKGRLLFVEGSLTVREYQSKNGETKTVLEIKASDIKFMGSA